MLFIGIDIGTMHTKGILANESGQIINKCVLNHSVKNHNMGWAEQDADQLWWAETVYVIRSLLVNSNAEDVVGIGVSGLFPCLLLADKNGRPLRSALLYSDNRALEELSCFRERFGLDLSGDSIPPKLAWLWSHEPDIVQQTRYYFSSHNYVVFRLTGVYYLDYKVADSYGALLNRDTLEWNIDVAQWAGFKVENLPKLFSANEVVGQITKEAAKETGLKPGTPVIAGSGDSLLTLLGTGVVEKGDAALSFGTTGWLAGLTHDLKDFFNTPRLLNDGAPYKLSAYIITLCSALEWLEEKLSPYKSQADNNGETPFSIMDKKALEIPAGAEGVIVLPNFHGSRSISEPNYEGKGIIYGLDLYHNSDHIYRALLESFGYIVRQSIERLKEQNIEIKRIICSGGGASSNAWRQIISDILDYKLTYYENGDSCIGSAYLVSYSLGIQDSLSGITKWLNPPIETTPSRTETVKYKAPYNRFISIQDAFKTLDNIGVDK